MASSLELNAARERLRQFSGVPGNYSEAALVATLVANVRLQSSDVERFRVQVALNEQSVDLTRFPYPSLVLNPADQEQCAVGHFGTLCTQCEF